MEAVQFAASPDGQDLDGTHSKLLHFSSCLSAQNQANVLWAGLYLDAIGYDRATMQRVRRVLDSAKPGSLIDVHQGTRPANGSCNGYPTSGDSPALNYMQHLPSIDRVW